MTSYPLLLRYAPRHLALVAFVFWVAVILSRRQRPLSFRAVSITNKAKPGTRKWPGFFDSCPASYAKHNKTETSMTEIEFNALAAQGYNRIPLIAETYADLDTPLAIYLKLAHSGPEGGRNTCLLESVVGGERFGRYSFIGLPAKTVIRSMGTTTEIVHQGKVVETHEGDPLNFIEAYQQRLQGGPTPRHAALCRRPGRLLRLRHGAPYRTAPGPAVKPFPDGQDAGTPDIMLLQVDELVIVDNLAGRTYLMVYADPQQSESYALAKRRLNELREKLRTPVVIPYAYASMQTASQRNFKKEDYIAAVLKAKEYIAAGDLMQVQIGQVITKPFRDSPLVALPLACAL